MANTFASGITLTETKTTTGTAANATLSFSRLNSYIINTAASGKIYLNSTIDTANNWGYFDATGFHGKADTATTATNLANKPTLNLTNTSGTGVILSVTAGEKTSDTITLGATSLNAMINALGTGDSALTANDYVITQYVGGGTSTVSYHRRPANKVINATLVKAALGTNSTHGGAYLRKDGTWQVPPNDNTTYTFTAGTSTLAWNSEVTLATTGGLAIKAKLPANPATFTAGTSTLAWNSEVTLATVNGSAIKAKLPANPNTDTKNTTGSNQPTNANIKPLYIIGASSQENNPVTYSYNAARLSTDSATSPTWISMALGNASATSGLITLYNKGGSSYTDFQASATSSKVTITLPAETGTVALTKNVVNLTGTQTITGTKTFGNIVIGGATGTDAGKSIISSSTLYLGTSSSSPVIFKINNTAKIRIDTDGVLRPEASGGTSLGTSAIKWNYLYTQNIYMGNGTVIESSGNDLTINAPGDPTAGEKGLIRLGVSSNTEAIQLVKETRVRSTMILRSGTSYTYGTSLPTGVSSTGRIFFLLV